MLKNNVYTENFSGQHVPIVQIRGIRKVYIDDDTCNGSQNICNSLGNFFFKMHQ
jgi:hypothetical protein